MFHVVAEIVRQVTQITKNMHSKARSLIGQHAVSTAGRCPSSSSRNCRSNPNCPTYLPTPRSMRGRRNKISFEGSLVCNSFPLLSFRNKSILISSPPACSVVQLASSKTRNMNGTTATEQEPLLGRPGDATQTEEKSLFHNLVLGTAALAQGGIWVVSFPCEGLRWTIPNMSHLARCYRVGCCLQCKAFTV